MQASVIVADEVSMVDAVMMEKFLWAVNPEKTKLIFLGDKDQLPSVEAGAVFAEMIPDGSKARGFKNRIISLQTCYRSGLNLIGLAKQVNAGVCPEYAPGDFDTAMSLGENQWAFVKAGSLGAWKKYLQIWAQRHYTDFRDTEGHTFSPNLGAASLYRLPGHGRAYLRGTDFICRTDRCGSASQQRYRKLTPSRDICSYRTRKDSVACTKRELRLHRYQFSDFRIPAESI